jgi:hypothetical protein
MRYKRLAARAEHGVSALRQVSDINEPVDFVAIELADLDDCLDCAAGGFHQTDRFRKSI